CRQLAERGVPVILASRDRAAGETAAVPLRRKGHALDVCTLDVTRREDVEALAAQLGSQRRQLRGLVNNAGVLPHARGPEIAERTLATNYFGTVALTEALLPHLAVGANVVMVSSQMGELRILAPRLRERFLDPALDHSGLDALMRRYVEDVGRGRQ